MAYDDDDEELTVAERDTDAGGYAPPAQTPPGQAKPAGPGGALGAYQPRTAHGAEIMAQRAAKPAPFQFADGAEAFSIAPPPEGPQQGLLGDLGDQLWNSTLTMGKDALGLAAFATQKLTGDPESSGWLDRQKAGIQEHIDATTAGMSTKGQAASKASVFNSGDDPDAPTWGQAGYVRTLATTAAGFIPDLIAALVPATLGAKIGVRLAGMAVKLGETGAKTAATVGAHVATGATFGTIDAGAAWNTITEQLERATPEEMAKSPVYQHLRETMSDHEAKAQMLSSPAVSASVLAHFGVGGVAGAAGGSLLRSGAFGGAGRGVLGRAGLGAAEGAGLMGGQAGIENPIDQAVGQGVGVHGAFDAHEMAQAVGSGLVMGGLLGGAGGALHGRKVEPTRMSGKEAPTVSPEIAAAMDATLSKGEAVGPAQGEMDLSQAPPGVTPTSGGQQDMFRTTQQANPIQVKPGPTAPPGQRAGDPVGPVPRSPPLTTEASTQPAGPIPPPVTTPGMAPTATQADIAMREPPMIADPRLGAAPDSQGEMFRDHTGTTTGEIPPVSGSNPAETTPKPANATVPINAGVTPTPAAGTKASVPFMITKAMKTKLAQAGFSPDQISQMTPAEAGAHIATPKVSAETSTRVTSTQVQRRDGVGHNEAVRRAAAENAAVAADSGRTTPTVVVDPGVASASAVDPPRGGVLTSPAEPATAAPSAKVATPKPAGLVESKSPDVGEQPVVTPVEPNLVVNAVEPKQSASEAAKITTPEPAKSLTKGEQLRAEQAAKRALAKAKQATPTKKPIASGAHVDTSEAGAKVIDQDGRRVGTQDEAGTLTRDDETQNTPATAARASAETVGRVHAAASRAARMEGLPPGVVDGWVRDVVKVIQGTHTDLEAHEALAAWGSEKAPITGAKVQRAVVADKMMRLLTATEENPKGTGLKSRRAVNEEISAEATKDRAVYENEGVTRADITERDEPAGADQGEKTRAAATTNKDRILSDLEQKIREGTLDVTQAEAHYGDAAVRGRKREFSSVVDYLSRRLKAPESDKLLHEADPAVREHITRALDEHAKEQADPVGYALARETARTEAAEAKANQARAVRSRTVSNETLEAERAAEHAPAPLDNAEAARKARVAEMQARMAAEGKPLYRRAAKEDGLTPASSRYAQDARDPALNSFVADRMKAAEQTSGAHTLHDALRTIVDHSPAGPLRDLASRLLTQAPDIQVLSPRAASNRAGMSNELLGRYAIGELSGHHQRAIDGNAAHIVLSSDRPVETLLHEALHSVTREHIDTLWRHNPAHPDLQALLEIRQELINHAATVKVSPALLEKISHATVNPHEIHAWLLTNPELQAFAASRAASPLFRTSMSQLGFAPREHGRSVWRAFTDWTRKVLGLPKVASASEYTLLDHVMRPLQDITDRAAEHNTRNLPNDPGLRAQAEPLYKLASGLGRAGDELRGKVLSAIPDEATAGRVMNKSRPATLAATATDQIVERYHQLFNQLQNFTFSNPLVRIRDANEKIAHAAKGFTDALSNLADNVVTASRRLAPEEQAKLGALLNDATIAEVKLGNADPKANDHLTKPEEQAALKALEARFAQLTPEARAVHRDLIDLHADMGKRERAAQLAGILGRAFPDATEAQRKAFADTVHSRKSLEKFLADPDNSILATAHGPDGWTKQRALSVAVAKVFESGWVRGDYSPLGRFGDFVVRYGEKGEDSYGVERFEKQADADARYAELKAADTIGLRQVDLTEKSALRELTRDHPMVNQVEDALRGRADLADHADAVRDIMNRIILQASTRSEVARMRRQGVQGASVDFARVLGRDFVNTSARIGYLEHGGERFKALGDMRLMAEDLSRNGQVNEAITARQVLAEMEQKISVQEHTGGVMEALSRKATAFGYVQAMMSPSHMILNTLDIHALAVPRLGARHNPGRVLTTLARALADVAPKMLKEGARNTMNLMGKGLKAADWNLAHFARDSLVAKGADQAHMHALFDGLDRSGLIDHTMIREMRRIAKGGGTVSTAVGRMFERFVDLNSAMTHAVDIMNKSAVAKASFDLEMRHSKGNVEQSIKYATDMVRNTSPNYNLGNKARISTSAGALGQAGAPLMQFKQYGFFAYGTLGNLVKASMNGATKEARWESQKALAGIIATQTMLAGTMTWLADPLRYIGGAYDLLFTDAAKPHNRQFAIRGFYTDTFGPEMGQVLSNGVLAGLGLSVNQRLGMNNPLGVPALESFDKAGVVKMVAAAAFGASGDNAMSAADGLFKLMDGDMSGLKTMVPRPIRDAAKAYGLATEGVKNTKGQVTLPADRISWGGVAAQAFGIQPTSVSEFRVQGEAIRQASDEAKNTRSHLTQAWLKAEPIDRAAVMSQIRVFNTDPMHHGMALTVDQLMRARHEAAKQTHQSPDLAGVKVPAKAARALAQAGAFANVH